MHDPLTDAYLALNAWGGRLVVRLDHQRGYLGFVRRVRFVPSSLISPYFRALRAHGAPLHS